MKNIFIVFILTILVTSCSPPARITDGIKRGPYSGTVLTYEMSIPSYVNYSVIGNFEVGKIWYGSRDETTSEAKAKASELGANAILIEKSGFKPSGFSWAAPYTSGKLIFIENYDEVVSKKESGGKLQSESKVTPAERLLELKSLKEKGLISDDEYSTHRSKIINGL